MKKVLVIAALLIAVAVPASALTTLNFEGLPAAFDYFGGSYIGSYYPGVTLGPDAVTLTDGVSLNTAGGYLPHSGVSVFRPYVSGYVDFTFDGTVSYFEGWFTFYGNGYMEAYDAADALVASDTMASNLYGSTMMSVSAAGIKRVRIHDGTEYWIGDDIAFEPCGEQVVPEPTSLILGALGLSSLVGVRRLRRG